MTREHVSMTAVGALAALALTPAFWPMPADAHTEDDPFTTPLVADGGDNPTEVGEVQVWNDADDLHLTYLIDDPTAWCMTKTHAHIELDPGDIPQTARGNPIPGRFELKKDHDACPPSFGVTIALGGWSPDTVLNIAAYAKVTNLVTSESEGAWGGVGDPDNGAPFPGPNWATYFTYTVQAPPVETSCVCDSVQTPGGTTFAQILEFLCPGGELRQDVEFLDSDVQTLVSEFLPKTAFYVAFAAEDGMGSSPHCRGRFTGVDDGFSIIELAEAQACRSHLRASCGQQEP